MSIKITKTLAITSWLFLILSIVLPAIGVAPFDWGNLSAWIVLSMFWTFNLMEDLIKIKEDKIEEQHDKTKSGL